MAIRIPGGGTLPLSGGTLTGPLLLPNGTAAAPSLGFASNTDVGLFYDTLSLATSFNSSVVEAIDATNGHRLASTMTLGWTNGGANASAADTILSRIGDGVLGLKSDGTSAASLYVYGDGSSATKTSRLAAESLQTQGISKTLTDNVATGFVKIAVAQGASGGARIRYTVKCIDAGLDQQVEQGELNVAWVNKGGTLTISDPNVAGKLSSGAIVSAGTMTNTFTAAEVDADTVTISVTSDTSLTPSPAGSFAITYFVEMNAAATVTQL